MPFSRISASLAYGGAGLFNEEYVLHVKHSSSVGKFSSGLFAFDACYVMSSGWTFGVRAHTMRGASAAASTPKSPAVHTGIAALAALRMPMNEA